MDDVFTITEKKAAATNSTKDSIIEMMRERWALENHANALQAQVSGLDDMARELRERADRTDFNQRELLKNLAKVVDECDDLLNVEANRLVGADPEDPVVQQSKKWRRKLERTREHLMERLKSYGVTTRMPVGAPNPDLDTVYGVEESNAAPPGEVLKVMRAGLLWNGTVLRCSLVTVAAPEGGEKPDADPL